eukprot:TRINITY_DN26403_c0_g1_i4.p1 TRINITY_DN26403_c0_g1~~TRINITY_DN26403_c0_g1_i4.p1  ORF type:complete len:422 (-),score=63.45 TRINITY_DN26403_c0_g1_i4:144-1409(-)
MEPSQLDVVRANARRLGGWIALPPTVISFGMWLFVLLGWIQTFSLMRDFNKGTNMNLSKPLPAAAAASPDDKHKCSASCLSALRWYNRQHLSHYFQRSNPKAFLPWNNLHALLQLLQFATLTFSLMSSIADITSRLGVYNPADPHDVTICSFLAQAFVIPYLLGKLCSFRFFACKMMLMLNEVSTDEVRSRVYLVLSVLTVIMFLLIGVVGWLSAGDVSVVGTQTCTYTITDKNKLLAFIIVGSYTGCESFINGTLLLLFIKPLLSSASFSKRLREVAYFNLLFGSLTIFLTSVCMVLLSVFVIVGTPIAVAGTTITNFDSFANCCFQMICLRRSWTVGISNNDEAIESLRLRKYDSVESSTMSGASKSQPRNLISTVDSHNSHNSPAGQRLKGSVEFADRRIQPFLHSAEREVILEDEKL